MSRHQSPLERWQIHRDPAALHELVDEFSGMVFATSCRILGDRTEAEDVAQECFLALAQSDTVRPDAVAGWLHGVAVRQSLYRRRSEYRRREREVQYTDRQAPSMSREEEDLYRHVDEAVEELPEELRTPLVAHYMEGQSHAVIARRLGVPRRTLSHRIERGVKQVGNTLRRRGIHAGGVVVGLILQEMSAEASVAPGAVRDAVRAWSELADAATGTVAHAARTARTAHKASPPLWKLGVKVGVGACATAVLSVAALSAWPVITQQEAARAGALAAVTVEDGAESADEVRAAGTAGNESSGGGVGGSAGGGNVTTADSGSGPDEGAGAWAARSVSEGRNRVRAVQSYYDMRSGGATRVVIPNAREANGQNIAGPVRRESNRPVPRRAFGSVSQAPRQGALDAGDSGFVTDDSGMLFTIDDRLVGETPAIRE